MSEGEKKRRQTAKVVLEISSTVTVNQPRHYEAFRGAPLQSFMRRGPFLRLECRGSVVGWLVEFRIGLEVLLDLWAKFSYQNDYLRLDDGSRSITRPLDKQRYWPRPHHGGSPTLIEVGPPSVSKSAVLQQIDSATGGNRPGCAGVAVRERDRGSQGDSSRHCSVVVNGLADVLLLVHITGCHETSRLGSTIESASARPVKCPFLGPMAATNKDQDVDITGIAMMMEQLSSRAAAMSWAPYTRIENAHEDEQDTLRVRHPHSFHAGSLSPVQGSDLSINPHPRVQDGPYLRSPELDRRRHWCLHRKYVP
ncbi:hypothetical protein BDK51DRAFT_47378 [Blyttiomyces helicus]|uniref:Uncharacterized protein n=1 Tax=Blyttiomyces helicus TaxID=388810 RepID=A0A4P9W2L8_9FUNG|nr:hypothetical protein BDK51DRAFT_47378 [Blyttiomyces helicus]|eukprot:RKO85992.1 hypothetical protein BDK51DRAFT_47378 [Blyttiomyces helicus]